MKHQLDISLRCFSVSVDRDDLTSVILLPRCSGLTVSRRPTVAVFGSGLPHYLNFRAA